MSSETKKSDLENASDSDSNPDNDYILENSSETSSEEEKKINKPKVWYSKTKKVIINMLQEFLVIILAVVVYSAITNDSPKIGKSPSAYPFFENTTYLTDWYRGEISRAIKEARQSDISFVMFYAPWNADSQYARKEFELTAKYLHKEVTFAAVNCWQPESECRTQYNKVYKWPILIAYLTQGRGVQYKGPIIAEYMVKFLQNIMFPYIRNTNKRKRNVAFHDAVITVHTNPYSKKFKVMYKTVLRLLEHDPLRDISVVLETHPKDTYESLLLDLWNRTVIYPNDEWIVDDILKWILKNLEQITTWFIPTGSKSTTFSNFIIPGPTLILFTPKNPLFGNDFYNTLRELSFEFHACGENNKAILLELASKVERKALYLQFLKNVKQCSDNNINIIKDVPDTLFTNTSYCIQNIKNSINISAENDMLKYYGGVDNLCSELLKYFDKDSQKSSECFSKRSEKSYQTSQLTEIPDRKSYNCLKDHRIKLRCRTLSIAQTYHPFIFSSDLYKNDEITLKGLACNSTNKTLSFIAMDSLKFYHFAERIGIDLRKAEHKSAAVIFNDKTETHYVLKGKLTGENLRKFIRKFNDNTLRRNLGSMSTVKSKHTHFYQNRETRDRQIFMREISSENFLYTILQKEKAVIVFYYSKQCSFCNGIANRILTVAKYLSPISEITFTRIDGDLNLLPWEYTMDTFPTLLLVPANKKTESRVFPRNLPITVSNLLGFILLNLEPPLRLEVMWTLCGVEQFYANLSNCTVPLRYQIEEFIDMDLQVIRNNKKIKTKFAHQRIQHLHDLYFAFCSNILNKTIIDRNIFALKKMY